MTDLSDRHFFRHEWGRLIAVLVRMFGVHNLALAEDIAQEALWSAMEVWKVEGPPQNPSAWLTRVAKRRAIDALRRTKTRERVAPELARWLESEWTRLPAVDELFSAHTIRDDELRMMFSLAQPRLPEESRVGLILQLLCGFSDAEVAAAFLSPRQAMAKRLQRAKRAVANSRALFELRDEAIPSRLESVQSALYLLFNEGYHGASPQTVRQDLCAEAMRLSMLLVEHPLTSVPSTLALAALMRLHAARLPARLDGAGELVAYRDQERSRWDHSLVSEGLELLARSASGDTLSPYHLEAAIGWCHMSAPSVADTSWLTILQLYDRLLTMRPSPIVALNRAIAVGQTQGPKAGLRALKALDATEFAGYPFYEAALGEFSLTLGRHDDAYRHLSAAARSARGPRELRYFASRLASVRGTPSAPKFRG